MTGQPLDVGDNQRPTSPYRSSARRAAVAVALLGASAVVAGGQFVLSAIGLSFVQRSQATPVTAAEVAPFVALTGVIGLISLGLALATAVAYLAWLSRAVDNVPALGGGHPPSNPTWAIAWWFIPFANLGMPYEVVRDLRARMRGDLQLSHPLLLVAWWFTFILGQVGIVAFSQAPTGTPAQVGAGFAVALVAQALTACAGVLAIVVVRDIEVAAGRRAARIRAGEPMPSGLLTDAETAAKGQTGWRMRPSWVGFVAIAVSMFLPVALVAGIGSAGEPPAAGVATGSPTARSTAPPEPVSSGTSSGHPDSPDLSSCRAGGLPHEAAELEPLLPTTVDGRSLEVWSVSGTCWLTMAFSTDAGLAEFTAILDERAVDVDDLRLAVAGRASLESDPPYFVYVLSIPDDPDAYEAAAFLLLGMIVGPENVQAFTEADFEAANLGGKEVSIGAMDLIPQTDHQRGRPYEYVSATHTYLVVSEEDAWAEDALRQLE